MSVAYEHNSDFAEFNYRNGFGAVEGVVAHETANDYSTIRNEIDYMGRNHENAFVHAFVDHNNIIEIHPTDLGAWGAGRYANERFVHVELVRVNTFEQFAKSINNYSDYLASVLYEYNLGVTSAEKDGKGTLWSHNAVSRHLGGTTHVDPHGYFARWDYNWNDFVSLVKEKYKEKVRNPARNTSKLGHINSSNARVYDDPTNLNDYDQAGSKRANEVFYIKTEAKLNGKHFYLISREPSTKKGTVGWVQAKDMSTHNHNGIDKKNKSFKVHGNGKAYDTAWGGSENQVYDLSDQVGETFDVNLTEAVGNNTWYRGMLDGQEVWIHYSYLINDNNTSKLGHFKSKNGTIYSDLSEDAASERAGEKYINAVYYIKKEVEVNRETYYLISNKPSSSKGTIGWVKASDMKTHSHTGVDKENKTYHIDGSGNAYAKAWGGSKDLVYDLSDYKYSEFNVHLTEKVGKNTWYRGTLGGETVWIHSSYLITKETSNTSKLGHLRSGTSIYETIGDDATSFSAESYLNAVYYIKEQVIFNNNQVYYLISSEPSSEKGVVGWVKAEDLSTHSHKGVDREAKLFSFKGTGNAYAKAWGGSEDFVYDLSNYKDHVFNVHKTETVGSNTWYRGDFNGERIWVHERYVTELAESSTSRLGHLRNASTMYGPDSSFSSEDYQNAVYYIKKEAEANNQLYYLISTEPSSKEGVVSWVKAENLSTHSHKAVDRKDKTFLIKGTGNAYAKAWGGSKDLVYDLSDYENHVFNVHKTETVGSNTWYRGDFNGERIWVHESYVIDLEESSTSRLGHLRKGSTIYNASSSLSSEDYLNAVYYIKKQVIADGQTYYLISTEPSSEEGVVGWVKAKDLSTHSHVGVDKNAKTFTVKGTGDAYTKAWGGSNDLVYDLSDYKNEEFNVHLTEKVGSNTWYRGNLGGKTVWMHSSYLK